MRNSTMYPLKVAVSGVPPSVAERSEAKDSDGKKRNFNLTRTIVCR